MIINKIFTHMRTDLNKNPNPQGSFVITFNTKSSTNNFLLILLTPNS